MNSGDLKQLVALLRKYLEEGMMSEEGQAVKIAELIRITEMDLAMTEAYEADQK